MILVPLAVDPSVYVAAFGMIGLLGSAGVAAYAAIKTNRNEKTGTAHHAVDSATDEVEEALRERLLLSKEELEYERRKVADRDLQIVDLTARLDRCEQERSA